MTQRRAGVPRTWREEEEREMVATEKQAEGTVQRQTSAPTFPR